MKVYVIGSTAFMHDMVRVRDELKRAGLDGWLHSDYDLLVKGELPGQQAQWETGERADIKRQKNYLRVHYDNILQSDAVLVVNKEKNGVENYIGGNVLIEMGQAYVNHKQVFLLHEMPKDLPYLDEIIAMDPICLHGDVTNINSTNSIAQVRNQP